MTNKQKLVITKLYDNPGGMLRMWKTVSGRDCFRLVDRTFSPLGNFQVRSMDSLYYAGWLKKKPYGYVLNREKFHVSRFGKKYIHE